MRKYRYCLAALVLVSCTKSPPAGTDAPAQPQADTVSATAVLARTESHRDYTLIDAAARLVRSGGSLSPELAMRCLRQEKTRPRVREACVLAWSPGSESSAELDAAVRDGLTGESARSYALAIVKRPALVRSLSLEQLGTLLRALKDDPAWLRARALGLWLSGNPPPVLPLQAALWNLVALPSDAPDPSSLAEAWAAAGALSLGGDQALVTEYCPAGIGGVAAVRCLRFLSALASRGPLPPALRLLVPPPNDEAWLVFQRDFPERAILLGQAR